MKKENFGERVFDAVNILILTLMMLITLYPLWHVVVSSLSSNTAVMKHTGLIFAPLEFTANAYNAVFQNPMIIKGYMNTIFIVVAGCAVNILLTSVGAYVLSRQGVMWTKLMTVLIVFTMYFGGGLIPFYFTVKDMGLDGTLWALIFPTAISTFNLMIMRTSFASVPPSLEESARIDGASHLTVIFKIILPVSLPTVAVMLLYYGVGHWNSWFNAMIFLRTKRELYPLQLILREILLQNTMMDSSALAADSVHNISETIKYAIIVVATLPILFIYPFLQKYFVKGALIGAVKE